MPPLRPLAYRFRKRVRLHERETDALLILGYPLKVVFFNTALTPLLKTLSGGGWVPFDELAPKVPAIGTDDLEIFLDGLVRKGFVEREGFPKIDPFPSVSVIIPVRNRPREITACLNSLAELDYPSHKIEIIVVDDASTDETPRVVTEFPVRLIALK
jgi:mycofactocin glycosyltransferase